MEFQDEHAEEGETAGQPDDTSRRIVLTRLEIQKLTNVKAYIESHLDETLTISLLARKFLFSTTYLKQGFKQQFGIPVHQYVLHQRMIKAKQLLNDGTRIRQVAADVGYSLTGFSKIFKSYTGTPPSAFRNLRS